MERRVAQHMLGWAAVGLSTLIACVWAFWGIIENFHEGWYYPSLAQNLGLMLVQYLMPMLLFVSLALVGVRWPYVGSGLHLALALWLGFFFLHVRGAGSILLIYGPLLLLAGLYAWGRPQPLRLAYALLAGLPLLTPFACAAGPEWRIAALSREGTRAAGLLSG